MLRCVWHLPLSPFRCKDNRSTWLRVVDRVCTRAERRQARVAFSVSRFVYVLPACLRPIEKFAATRVRPRALVCRNSRIDVTNSGRPTSCFARLQMKTKVYAVLFSFYSSSSLFLSLFSLFFHE